MYRLKPHHLSIALLLGSVVCLTATAHLVMTSGPLAYFVAFHAPFHIQLAAVTPVAEPALPHFAVQHEISQANLSAGGTQTIHVTVTARQTTRAYLEIWIRGPNNREVYKYPTKLDTTPPMQFAAGQAQTFDEVYTLPAAALPGTYTVSASIVSVDQHVDYYDAHAFASFEVL